MNHTNPHYSVLLPESLFTASRYELNDIPLQIEGELPNDIQGHSFLVAPVGSLNSGGLPYPGGNSLISGDGMIYRVDFNQPGKATIKSRLVKSPDYYADKATQPGSPYEKYRFRTHGISRFSLSLGLRNELNTAFLPMPFSPDSQQRLLVTYDAGRPYEIDTETLEAVTPVGANSEWRPEMEGLKFPFPSVLSSAHPVFDAHTGEMFTVNYARSFENLLKSVPFISQLAQFPQELDDFLEKFNFFTSARILETLIELTSQTFQALTDELGQLLASISGIHLDHFVYLVRWNGQGYLERWKLVLPDGSSVKIRQTIHQIGLSEDYIVLMDTAFTTGLEEFINNPLPEYKNLEATLRYLLDKPENPNSVIYLVRRQDLKRGQYPALEDSEVEITVKQLSIPMEASHFLMDYKNPEGQVTLHIAHICAWNVAEWIRPYDVSAYENHQPVSERVHGMDSSETDISRLGHHVIDGKKGS